MRATDVIRKKRDGERLCDDEIAALVDGIADGSVTDAHIAAFAMAVYFRGMSRAECVALTRAMTRSGTALEWRSLGLGGPILDKHSTGGVGDKVSLILAPVVAACGGFVPMISGRGLAHTGGTLDKLESIPGYRATPDLAGFRAAVRAAGCAIVGQTGDLAPADRRIYAVRDVTATTDSVPLITASILSKKLAAGLDALVLDVKAGSGALLEEPARAPELAESLLAVASGAGLRTAALITDMAQPLGADVGNAVETREAIDFLAGRRREPRLAAVTAALSAELLVLGGLAPDLAAAGAAVARALDSGAAADRFARMTTALGGPADVVEHPERHLPRAPVELAVEAERAGTVTAVHARSVGRLVMELGGGRRRSADAIDPTVGVVALCGVGDTVERGQRLAVVHARTAADAEMAARVLRAAVTVEAGPSAAAPPPVLRALRPD